MEILIVPIEKSLIIRGRGSELLILEQHVGVLKGLKKSQDFIDYFTNKALVNRAARKLFESWLRKDNALWKKVYDTIGKMDVEVLTEKEAAKHVTDLGDKQIVTKANQGVGFNAQQNVSKDVANKKVGSSGKRRRTSV